MKYLQLAVGSVLSLLAEVNDFPLYATLQRHKNYILLKMKFELTVVPRQQWFSI
jgi:hypothetical protein